jgi:hypothetical protein
MDCDLQDRPEEIQKSYNKALEVWNIVNGSRDYGNLLLATIGVKQNKI